MPKIINAYSEGSGGIADSLKSIGESIWGNEARNEGQRQNAMKLQRENSARELGAAALSRGDYTDTLAQGFRSGPGAGQDTANYIAALYANKYGAKAPETQNALVGRGEAWSGTPQGAGELQQNQRAMEQDRTDASRFTPVYSQDVYGNKTPSGAFNTRQGTYQPFNGAPPTGAPQRTGMQPVGMADELPGTAGEDGINHGHFSQLAAENPEIASHVAAVLDGREPFPTLQTMRNNPMAQAVSRHVSLVEPGFDATKWFERKRTNDYFSGRGEGAIATKSANQTIKHMYDMAGYADDLRNVALPGVLAPLSHAYNTAGNTLGKMGNATAPGKFELSHTALSDEIGKLFKSGQLTDTEARRWADAMPNIGDTPDQLRAKTEAMLTLYNHVLDTLEEQRAKGMSPLGRGRVQPLMDQSTADMKRRLEGWSHGQPLNAPGAKAQYGQMPQGAPQPVVTPQSQAGPDPAGSAIAEARAAIAAGAPRDAVIRRLQEHGIPPDGL